MELPIETFQCVFEIRVPLVEYFDHEKKIKGIEGYNIDRVVELANRDYFHGEVQVEYLEEGAANYEELDRCIECKVMRIRISSNKIEKFNLASKLVHELAANVQEDFKRFCHRQSIDIAHIFKIMRIDLTDVKLDLVFQIEPEEGNNKDSK